MAGYVYLIGSSTFKWYNIGKASRAAIRVSELGILLPFRIEVIAVWKLSNYYAVERDLHEKHAANRINGEWFSFTKEEIKGIVDDMLWASTDSTVKFSNLQKDHAPKGLIVKGVSLSVDITDEERERRKQEGMAKSAAKRALREKCPTCGHHTFIKTP